MVPVPNQSRSATALAPRPDSHLASGATVRYWFHTSVPAQGRALRYSASGLAGLAFWHENCQPWAVRRRVREPGRGASSLSSHAVRRQSRQKHGPGLAGAQDSSECMTAIIPFCKYLNTLSPGSGIIICGEESGLTR